MNKVRKFSINTRNLGSNGNLIIEIACDGEYVSHEVKSLGNKNYEISFIPKSMTTHYACIRLNGIWLKGSPFAINLNKVNNLLAVPHSIENSTPNIATISTNSVNNVVKTPLNQMTTFKTGDSGKIANKIEPPKTLNAIDKIKVFGPGITHGVIGRFESMFICDTKEAGTGDLSVRIRGPKGAFQVEMQRDNHKDKLVTCRYHPTEAGDYEIFVKWSGVDINGSPFPVKIFNTKSELADYLNINSKKKDTKKRFPSQSTAV